MNFLQKEAYNERLDMLALEGMKCLLADGGILINNTPAAVANWSYQYAEAMLKAREDYIK